MGLFLLSF